MPLESSTGTGWPRLVRVGDWPIAAKMTALCTLIAVLLAAALTTIGYFKASAGLTAQAESAIGADARQVQTTIDDWHQQRLAVLRLGAAITSVEHIAELGDAASQDDRARALATLGVVSQHSPDIESIAVVDATGTQIWATDAASVGINISQRDFFSNPCRDTNSFQA